MADGRKRRAHTICAINFDVFRDLGTRKTSGGVNLKVTQDLVRCQRPRVVHAGPTVVLAGSGSDRL